MTLPNIVDQFSQVAALVSSAYGQTVHFRHGHMLEVANIVQQMVKDPDIDKRYPILALQHDFEQDPVQFKGTELKGLKLYIITLSRPEYIAEQRKELIFKPILYHIRDILIEQIARSGYFEQQTVDDVLEVITLTDRYYWGSSTVMGNTANTFLDWVDCIEIEIDGLISYGAACGTAVTYPRLVNALTDTGTNTVGEYLSTGLKIYINFDTEMSDPSGLHADINIINGSAVERVQLSFDKRSFICSMPVDDIGMGLDIYLSINGGVFYTEDGIELKPITMAYIQNNSEV